MSNRIMDRRLLLRRAGAVGATALGGTVLAGTAPVGSATAVPLAVRRRHPFVGAWLITHRDDPGGNEHEVQGVVTAGVGGVLTSQDIDPVSPTGLGAWRPDGRRGYRAVFWAGSRGEQPGQAVTLRVRVRGTTRRGQTAGRYRFRVFDAALGDMVARGTGTFEGHRLVP
jgi:hypothetical protein